MEPKQYVTREEVKSMIAEQCFVLLAKYEEEKVAPRHRETTDSQVKIQRMVRTLVRNGDGGPKGAVEVLQDDVSEIKRLLREDNVGIEKRLGKAENAISYGRGYILGIIVSATIISTVLGAILEHIWK